MASSPSASVLAELQSQGENLNTWGDGRLNTALQMLEAAGHGLTSHTLTGNVSLTYTNFTKTNGTDYVQKIASGSDGAYTLTLGGYERAYLIWNASSYDQIIACSGDSVPVYAGEVSRSMRPPTWAVEPPSPAGNPVYRPDSDGRHTSRTGQGRLRGRGTPQDDPGLW